MRNFLRKWLGIELNTEAIKALDSDILSKLKSNTAGDDQARARIEALEARIGELENGLKKALESLGGITDSASKLGDVVSGNTKEIAKINAGLSVIVKNLQAQADASKKPAPKKAK